MFNSFKQELQLSQLNRRAGIIAALLLVMLWMNPFQSVAAPVEKELTLYIGQTAALTTYSVEFGTLQASTAVWASSHPSVAGVDSKGTVTAIAAGSTEIKATSTEGTEIKEVKLIVNVKAIVKSIAIVDKVEILPLKVGEKKAFGYKMQLEEGFDKPIREGVYWTSVDPKIATVDASGTVTGVTPGRVMIYVTSNDGTRRDSFYAEVVSTVKSMRMGASELTLNVGAQHAIQVTYLPEEAYLKESTYKVDEPSVLTVDDKGLMTAKQEGVAYVTATTKDGGYAAATKVIVKTMVKSVALDQSRIDLSDVKPTAQLKATLIPVTPGVDPLEKGIVWSSGNSSILSVSSTGELRGLRPGVTYAQATSVDGKIAAYCHVESTVTEKNITVNPVAMDFAHVSRDLVVGKRYLLQPVLKPTNATNKSVSGQATLGRCFFETINGELYMTPLTQGPVTVVVNHPSGLTETLTFKAASKLTNMTVTDSLNGIKDRSLLLYVGQTVDLFVQYEGDNGWGAQDSKTLPYQLKYDTKSLRVDKDSSNSSLLKVTLLNHYSGTLTITSPFDFFTYDLQIRNEVMAKDLIVPATAKFGVKQGYRVMPEFVLKETVAYGAKTVFEPKVDLYAEELRVIRSFVTGEIAYEKPIVEKMSKELAAITNDEARKEFFDTYNKHFMRYEQFKMMANSTTDDYVHVYDASALTDRTFKKIPFFDIKDGMVYSTLVGKAKLKVVSREGLYVRFVALEVDGSSKELVLLDPSGTIVSTSKPEIVDDIERQKAVQAALLEKQRVEGLRKQLPKLTELDYPTDMAIASVVKVVQWGVVPESAQKNFKGHLTRLELTQIAVKLYEKLSKKTLKTIPVNYYTDTKDPSVNKAYALGLLGALGNRKFDGGRAVTWEETFILLQKVMTAAKVPAPSKVTPLKVQPFLGADKLTGLAKTYYNNYGVRGGTLADLSGEPLQVKDAVVKEKFLLVLGRLMK